MAYSLPGFSSGTLAFYTLLFMLKFLTMGAANMVKKYILNAKKHQTESLAYWVIPVGITQYANDCAHQK